MKPKFTLKNLEIDKSIIIYDNKEIVFTPDLFYFYTLLPDNMVSVFFKNINQKK